jgi:hypothetical protein
MSRHSYWLGAVALVVAMMAGSAAAQRSWDGGDGTFVWGDFGNWNPDGDPNANAISIGNLAAATNDTTPSYGASAIDSLARGAPQKSTVLRRARRGDPTRSGLAMAIRHAAF